MPGNAESKFDEDGLEEEAGSGARLVGCIFTVVIEVLLECIKGVADEKPLVVCENGTAGAQIRAEII